MQQPPCRAVGAPALAADEAEHVPSPKIGSAIKHSEKWSACSGKTQSWISLQRIEYRGMYLGVSSSGGIRCVRKLKLLESISRQILRRPAGFDSGR